MWDFFSLVNAVQGLLAASCAFILKIFAGKRVKHLAITDHRQDQNRSESQSDARKTSGELKVTK